MKTSSNIGRNDYQQDRSGGAEASQTASASPDKTTQEERPTHYCRGCGSPLPPGFRGHFHKKCLQADKRRRVQQSRLRQQRNFVNELRRIVCPHCGKTYGNAAFDQCRKYTGEASQAPPEG